jgi:3-deoxy-manno-octulosonate cytidylyltransferase (CMP-KDO synthetase)
MPAGAPGRALAIIPARMESTRFPGKPLVALRGAPMIRHVWEAVRRAHTPARVAIATDSEAIERAARAFGAEVVRTGAHETGPDRVAEAARTIGGEWDAIVNVQGDEPLLAPEALDAAVIALRDDPGADATTLAHWEGDPEALERPQCVFVDVDAKGYALGFRRGLPSRGAPVRAPRHVGLYAFRPRTLEAFASLPPTPAERRQGLEQLRLVEAGFSIRVVVTAFRSRAVDTPEDLAALERDWQRLAATAGGPATGSGDASA